MDRSDPVTTDISPLRVGDQCETIIFHRGNPSACPHLRSARFGCRHWTTGPKECLRTSISRSHIPMAFRRSQVRTASPSERWVTSSVSSAPVRKTALAYRDDIYEFVAGLEKQGRPWNDSTLIDDDLHAYRNMLCASDLGADSIRETKDPLMISLLICAEN